MLASAVSGVLIFARLSGETAADAASGCRATVSVVAHGQGSPDDLAWDGGKLLVSDFARGTIGAVARGQVHTLTGQIREPEGIVVRSSDSLEVAEQARNRLLDVNLRRHSRTTIVTLPSVASKAGADDIAAAPGGATYVPDSSNGDLYLLRGRHLTLLAGGMTRPVAVAKWGHGLAVADEYANSVWMIAGHARTRLATIDLPDDLAVVAGHLIAVNVRGEVWEVAPHLRLLSKAFQEPQGLVAAPGSSVIIADQATNTIYRLAGLSACL